MSEPTSTVEEKKRAKPATKEDVPVKRTRQPADPERRAEQLRLGREKNRARAASAGLTRLDLMIDPQTRAYIELIKDAHDLKNMSEAVALIAKEHAQRSNRPF